MMRLKWIEKTTGILMAINSNYKKAVNKANENREKENRP